MIYYLTWRFNPNQNSMIEILNFSQEKNPNTKYNICKRKYVLASDFKLEDYEPDTVFNNRITINNTKEGMIYIIIFENTSVNTGNKTYEIRLTGSKSTLTMEAKAYMRRYFFNYIADPNYHEEIIDNNIKLLKQNNSGTFTDRFNNNIFIITGTRNILEI